MIKAIFFDFDGVLTRDKTGSYTTTRYISEATGLNLPSLEAAFARHNEALTRGHCTHIAVWPEICRNVGADIDIDLLDKAFASTPLNHEMVSLARQLGEACIVGIVTDNKLDRMNTIERLHRLSNIFRPIVVSAAVGSTKADRAIFDHALASSHVQASECIFIDNDVRNLSVPRAMGMVALHFDDAANDVRRLIGELHAQGVVVGEAG